MLKHVSMGAFMLDRLVAAGQFRDCFIFLPEGSRLSGYTDHSRAVMAEEDSVADPRPRFSVSPPSYVMPSCESEARAKSAEADDPFKDRELPGRGHCPATADTFASLDFWSPRRFPNWQRRARHAGKFHHRSIDPEAIESASGISPVPLRTLLPSHALSSSS